ncbi:MAG: hypothetical protein PHR39_07875 [Actinomycetota bacterium]|nr:hypothetical protein [Actinomycetota bacterium]
MSPRLCSELEKRDERPNPSRRAMKLQDFYPALNAAILLSQTR